MRGERLICESRAVKRLVQKIAGTIAGKHSPGAIGSMCRRRETEDQKLRVRVAESWNGLTPIFPLEKCAPLFAGHFLAVPHQARTLPAAYDFAVQALERFQFFSPRKPITNCGANHPMKIRMA